MWLAALAACISTGVSGAIDGDAVEVASAAYAEVPEIFGGDGALFVYLLPGDNACELLSEWLGASEASRDPGELSDQWNATFPSDFWEVDAVLRVADPTVSQSGEWLEGTAWNENTEAAGEAYAEITHDISGRDEAFFSGVVSDPSAYYSRWYSEKGLLQLHRHRPGVSLSGVFTTQAADPDTGEKHGDLVIRFNADHCADVEAILSR